MRRKNDNISILTTSKGLRIVHRLSTGALVDYCGVVVRAGSRDDPDALLGLAHFVEHTIFKGTARRSSWHIINRMERVGGELNAYTTKEETVVYTAAPRGNVARSLELIADLVISSRFPKAELDKEREVVADEINSYLDTPADAVFDDFEDALLAGTPLGHNILGDQESLSKMHSEDCREYLNRWYTIPNMVVFYYGATSADRVTTLAEQFFDALPSHDCVHTALPGDFKGHSFDISRSIDSHQAHTVMGGLTCNMYSHKKHALSLLTNIIGGPGMNSLLNVALRERRGLVYSVEASASVLADCGIFTIYFGCDPSDTSKCCDIVEKQIKQLAANEMSTIALNRAKKQYIGQLIVSSDIRDSLAISTARRALFLGDVSSARNTIDIINAITPLDILEMADSLSNLSRLTLTQ